MDTLRTYEPYSLQGDPHERYAVRIGGCGGQVVARDWNLSRDQAATLCELLEDAREAGREEGVEA